MRVLGRAGSGRRFGLASWLGRRVRRVATGTGMLALAVPLAWPSGAGGQHLQVPTPASVRSGVVRLAAWVSGDSPPPPSVPQQQEGTAPGRQHQVPAAVTRAVARATGHAAGKGPGQLPDYAFPAAKVKQHVTGLADLGGPGSYSPATSTLVPSGTTAASQLYRNADGSYTRLESATGTTGAGTLTFSGPAGVGVPRTRVTSASLQVLETWAGQCPATATVDVTDASGQQVGHWAGKPPASGCGNGSAGGWVSVPVSAAGLRALDSQAGAQLTVTPLSPPAPAAVTPAVPSPASSATATPSVAGTTPAVSGSTAASGPATVGASQAGGSAEAFSVSALGASPADPGDLYGQPVGLGGDRPRGLRRDPGREGEGRDPAHLPARRGRLSRGWRRGAHGDGGG